MASRKTATNGSVPGIPGAPRKPARNQKQPGVRVVTKKGGHPLVITKQVAEKFLEGIRGAGMSLDVAAAFAGTGAETVRQHRKRDKQFDAQVKSALEQFKAQSQVIIAHAGLTHWTARAWLLERRFPEEFGRHRLEVSGPDGKPVPVDMNLTVEYFEGLSDEELRRLAAAGQPADQPPEPQP